MSSVHREFITEDTTVVKQAYEEGKVHQEMIAFLKLEKDTDALKTFMDTMFARHRATNKKTSKPATKSLARKKK